MGFNDPAMLSRARERDRVNLERFVRGLVIVTRAIQSPNGGSTRMKKFKVRALSKEPANVFTFTNDEGQGITIQVNTMRSYRIGQLLTITRQAYFQQQYNYSLRFPNLPCVQVTKKAWYPMELCEVDKGNKYTRKLNPEQVAEALKCTSRRGMLTEHS